MALDTTVSEIVARLRQGRFPNEQAVSQGVVLRLLQELGWDTWDTAVVWPEFQTGEGRADFALCHPPSKPAISIEVKQPGKATDAVRQSLEYAFHTGVPFVVLTDGITWSFYLPAEQGSYDERRVYKLDLYERPAAEAAEILNLYLHRSRVVTGEALERARQEYRSRSRQSQAQAAIPEAWAELVEKGDELLVDLLGSAVESKTGLRPKDDDVAEFLAKLAKPDRSTNNRQQLVLDPRQVSTRPVEASRGGNMFIRGTQFTYGNAKDAMVKILSELAKADGQFLERCSQHPDAQGRKRRYIARSAEELYPDRPDLRDYKEALPGGWLVATNLNNVLKRNIIRLGAEVAGLEFGREVTVDF